MTHTPTPSSSQPDDPAVSALLRRRVIIELRPDEVPLLAVAEDRHGTKRAAIVAALRAEARLGDMEAALTRHAAERADVEARLAAAKTTAAAQAARLAKERDAALTRAEKASNAAASRTDTASKTARDASNHAARLRRQVEERDATIAELGTHTVDWAYCARCHAWAPRDEWAWEPANDGEYAYHQPCGDHGPGVLDPSSRLVWQAT